MGADGMAAQFSEYTWIVKSFKRNVMRGSLELYILRYIAQKPIHGYALMNLFRRNNGVYFGPSEIYPRLKRLEREGLIECAGWTLNNGRPIKTYRITALGLKVLKSLEIELNHKTN